jgi:ABC-type enterochelin transport system permease subunit
MANSSSAITATSAPALAPVPYKGTYTLYLLTAEFMAQLFGGTSDGSNFWTVALDWLASDTTRTSLGTFVTSAQAVSTIAHHTIAVNAVLSTSAFGFDLLATETGTAPNLNMAGVVYAQIVAT